MPECSLCGKHSDELTPIELEGSILDVCDDCVKFGKRLESKKYKPIRRSVSLNDLESDTIFASDYGKRIKRTRESMNLTRTEFAKKINERESLIKRIESQTLEPDDELSQKIEAFLKIKLKEEI